jgi:hypothetical protein
MVLGKEEVVGLLLGHRVLVERRLLLHLVRNNSVLTVLTAHASRIFYRARRLAGLLLHLLGTAVLVRL